jgi:cell division protein FtsQ
MRGRARDKPGSRARGARAGLRGAEPYLRHGYVPHGRFRRFGSIAFRWPMLTLTALLVLAGGFAGIVSGGHVARLGSGFGSGILSAGFVLEDATLAGAERTSGADVYAALGIERGESIFDVDASEVRSRLLDLPWVADAEVRRTLPNGIAIRLIEKRPFALWHDGQSVVLIERSGGVIEGAETVGFEHLPLFAGVGAPEAAAAFLDALRPHRAVAARLQSINRLGERRWDVFLAGGVTVKLPEEGWESQLAELEMLIVEKAILEREIEIIDLRYPDHYVFRLHNGDSQPVSRGRRA